MSPRKMVLRELSGRHQDGSGGYTRPANIPGFTAQPSRYQAVINALLQERLIKGMKDGDGHLAVAVNADRLADVRKELRPWYASTLGWATAVVAVAVTIALVVVR